MNGSNDGRGAVAAATDAVRRDPLREDGHRALARAHLDAGDLCLARAAVQRYAQLTRRELGTEPSPDLWAMVGLSAWTHTRRSARPSAAGDRQHLVLGGRAGGVMAQAHR
ncbi:Bacterial transcriptional activator domain (plasmid) [Tsukamurella tyrosinosolvens]|uniref:bacterial transcriptional activator domain-containing protein n=1 Tax=Tsukamurella tyrosinosolvens TaxID=57704 RepID=UPI000944FCB8|nr:bacterial transcriptional activator domain-containing protein [Tsukamurella tyrosinosolvens]RDB49780.1 hypothetical protein DVB87_01125 [Tsukamurella tyrosinosolvens]VEH99608.1 Bacterial transcriptional activator domain [Tsukamurella tyrosinosolvens]